MKSFKILIDGKSASDIINSLEEIKKWIEKDFGSGQNANDDADYSFTSSGEYEEDADNEEPVRPKNGVYR